jgi:hypothetical protein
MEMCLKQINIPVPWDCVMSTIFLMSTREKTVKQHLKMQEGQLAEGKFPCCTSIPNFYLLFFLALLPQISPPAENLQMLSQICRGFAAYDRSTFRGGGSFSRAIIWQCFLFFLSRIIA